MLGPWRAHDGPMEGPDWAHAGSRKSEIDISWTPDDHFGLKLGPNESNRNNAQF